MQLVAKVEHRLEGGIILEHGIQRYLIYCNRAGQTIEEKAFLCFIAE